MSNITVDDLGDVEIIIEEDDQECFVFSNALPADVTFSVFGDNQRVDWKHDPKVYPKGFKSDQHALYTAMYKISEYMNSPADINMSLEEFIGFRTEVHSLLSQVANKVEA